MGVVGEVAAEAIERLEALAAQAVLGARLA
jgi:hypothetical protein